MAATVPSGLKQTLQAAACWHSPCRRTGCGRRGRRSASGQWCCPAWRVRRDPSGRPSPWDGPAPVPGSGRPSWWPSPPAKEPQERLAQSYDLVMTLFFASLYWMQHENRLISWFELLLFSLSSLFFFKCTISGCPGAMSPSRIKDVGSFTWTKLIHQQIRWKNFDKVKKLSLPIMLEKTGLIVENATNRHIRMQLNLSLVSFWLCSLFYSIKDFTINEKVTTEIFAMAHILLQSQPASQERNHF